LRPFGELALPEITAEAVENYLGDRLQSGRRIHTKFGVQLRGRIKPATAHQEFRILSHILNVAVKQKRLAANPCVAVEFPVSVRKSTRKPHYMSATEQAKIEIVAPSYLRNILVIISALGLRYKKELLPMKKEQVDLDSKTVFITDSKTPTGVAEVPLTDIAVDAFRSQIEIAGKRIPVPQPLRPRHRSRT
jgi:integrase